MPPAGFEPAAYCLEDSRSSPLSYGGMFLCKIESTHNPKRIKSEWHSVNSRDEQTSLF